MAELETCALCPRLCRTVCPVVSGVGREAAVPTLIAAAVYAVDTGQQPDDLAKAALGLCVDCGACEEYCHIGQPLPALLREARLRFDVASSECRVPEIEGDAALVAVQTDDRLWSDALSARLEMPVARWRTEDNLGACLRGTTLWSEHRSILVQRSSKRRIVVAHGAVAMVLEDCGVPFTWLHDLVPSLRSGVGSCRVGENPFTDGCCGGGGPLQQSHPSDARRMGLRAAQFLDSIDVDDSQCAAHLTWCGDSRRDAIARLIQDSK